MLKAIFFDLDGTLCHFQGNFKEVFIDSCSSIFQNCDADAALNLWSNIISKEGILTACIALEKMCAQLGLIPPGNCREVAKQFCHTYANLILPVAGAKELLQSLSRNYQLVLVTNGPMDMQNAAIDALAIRSYFDSILISGDPDVQFRKPNPLIFQMALNKTRACCNEALMIGDNIKADIEGAKNIGLRALLVGKTDDPNVECIETIQEIESMLHLKADGAERRFPSP